jgi:hypothetical protein
MTIPRKQVLLAGAARTAAAEPAPTAAVPDLSALPRRVTRRVGAELVTQHYFPVSHRSLETWPLTWRHVNGYSVCETAELFAVARAKLEAAPPIRSGRRPASTEAPAAAE